MPLLPPKDCGGSISQCQALLDICLGLVRVATMGYTGPMSTQLWHSDIRLPAGFTAPRGRWPLNYSQHAIRASFSDHYGEIRILKSLTMSRFDVVEVETLDGEVVKLVIRGSYNEDFDIVMAVMPTASNTFFVKTVWLNRKNDRHATLDRNRYVS